MCRLMRLRIDVLIFPFPFFSMKRSLGLAIIGSLLLTGTAFAQDTTFSQKPFTDVPASSPYYQAIEYLRTQNVVKGYIDGTYRPDTSINRAEFVNFIVNPLILDTNSMSGCLNANLPDSATTVFFPDVPRDSWYATDVCFAKIKNLINGYPDGTYGPANSINFVEAAKIISNVFSLKVTTESSGEFWY